MFSRNLVYGNIATGVSFGVFRFYSGEKRVTAFVTGSDAAMVEIGKYGVVAAEGFEVF